MSLTDTAGRAPRAPSRFATIKAALDRQKHDLRRADRRQAALAASHRTSQASAAAIAARTEPLRVLQAILDRADVIALDVPKRGHVRQIHLLLTIPTWLFDKTVAVAAIDENDEDTDGGEDDQDKEMDEENGPSLVCAEGHMIYDGNTGDDLEGEAVARDPRDNAVRQRLLGREHRSCVAIDPNGRPAIWRSIGAKP